MSNIGRNLKKKITPRCLKNLPLAKKKIVNLNGFNQELYSANTKLHIFTIKRSYGNHYGMCIYGREFY